MATIVYLHGFASVGHGPKSQALIESFPNYTVVAPDLPVDPTLVIQKVDEIVRAAKSFPIVFVGTSLGGFWANYFAQKYDAPCVLVNPAMVPSRSMYEWVGKSAKNYATGETVEVTMSDIGTFAALEAVAASNYNGSLVNVFAAKDDDVISYKDVVEQIRYSKSMTLTEDGGHRFELHWPMVVAKVSEIIAN